MNNMLNFDVVYINAIPMLLSTYQTSIKNFRCIKFSLSRLLVRVYVFHLYLFQLIELIELIELILHYHDIPVI